MMKSVRFGNKTAQQIMNDDWQQNIRQSIKKSLNFNISELHYQYLNENTLHMLKKYNYSIALNTFGIKYYLLLMNYQTKNYNIFINKKNEDMVIVNFNFPSTLYNTTLFDGELIKDKNNEWVYVVSDIFIYNNLNIRNEYTLTKRINLLKQIFDKFIPENVNHCRIDLKDYFTLEYIDDLYKSYIPSIPYKISGFYFQEENDITKSLMYIFPENRNTKVQQIKEQNNDIKTSLTKSIKQPNIDIKNPNIFEVIKTNLPDIYELHQNGSKLFYAGVPDMATSQRLSKIFDNNEKLMMKCIYNKDFNKWIPMELA